MHNNIKQFHKCPVCFYPGLEEEPFVNNEGSFEICSCCGIEFGYELMNPSDTNRIIELRNEWIKNGSEVFSKESVLEFYVSKQLENTDNPI